MSDEIEHINYQIPAQVHSKNEEPMYYIHKFWARKPNNVVAEYIKHYSKDDDIVLDPFAGSGVTALEAVKMGRKGIAIDINPIGSFITRCTAIDTDIELLNEAFRQVVNKVKTKNTEFYTTTCGKCGKKVLASHFVWQQNKETKKEHPIKIFYFCKKCSTEIMDKQPDSDDLRRIEKIEKMQITSWYPKIQFRYPDGKRFLQLRHDMIQNPTIEMLFTKRNLHLCSLFFEEIARLPEGTRKERIVKDLLKLTFTAFVAKSSKMNIVNVGGYSSKGRGWTLHFFWNPYEFIEQNPLTDFINQFGITLLAKKQTNGIGYRIARNLEELKNGDGNILILDASALDLIDEDNPRNSLLEKNLIDYVFTDPPYGKSIQYYELSFFWNSWLGFEQNYEEEIIINKNQGKNFKQYDQMLLNAFREIYKVLKHDKYMTVTFHNEKIQIRNSLIRSVVYSGFNLEKILYQSPSKTPAKSSLHPYGTPIGDYYIRFFKPKQNLLQTEQQLDRAVQERIIVDAVTTVLAERGEPTSYAWILNTIDTKLIERGYNLLSEPKEIKSVLDDHLGKEFIIVEVREGLKTVKKWWFKDPSSISHLEKIPLSERLEASVIAVLRKNIIIKFDDVLKEIFINFPNTLTPETQSIKTMISEYATKMSDGRWKIKTEVRDNNAHQNWINALVKLGKRFGFDVWSAHVSDAIEEDVLRDLRLDIIEEPLKKIREIDVLWLKNRQIIYVFEVENTTQITEAINRGSNIPYKTERIILIPDDKENLLQSKFQNVMLKERVEKDNWRTMLYSKLEDFMASRGKTLENFNNIAIKPRREPTQQRQISDF